MLKGCATYAWRVRKMYAQVGYDLRRRGRVSRVWDIRIERYARNCASTKNRHPSPSRAESVFLN
eukprot:5862367-Pyramimonas_sp.AAC.1